MRSLVYLEFRTLLNSITNLTRSPKRLIPAAVFGAWLLAWGVNILQISSYGHQGHVGYGVLSDIPVREIQLGVFIGLVTVIVVVVYTAFDSGIMVFSLADIDFLFATPVSRQTVLTFKLLKDYVKYAAWTMMLTVIMLPVIVVAMRYAGMDIYPNGLVSLASVLGLVFLVANVAHLVNLAFTYGLQRLAAAGVVIKLVLLAVPGMAILYTIFRFVQTGDIWLSLLWAFDSPLPALVFAPAKWTASLFLAPLIGVTREGWLQFSLLWIFTGTSFLILLSRPENIYEPALKTSVRYARTKAAMHSGDSMQARIDTLREKGKRPLGGLALPSRGRGAIALLWKNMLIRYRVSLLRVVFVLVVPVLGSILAQRYWAAESGIRYLPLVIPYFAWGMSFTVQPELRGELRYANILKSSPISSWKIMLAQVGSSILYTSCGILTFAVTAYCLIPACRTPLLPACAFVAVFLAFSNLSALAVSALLYPNTRDAAQNYLCVIVGLVFSGVVTAPTLIFWAFFAYFLNWPVYVTATAICLANLALGAAGVLLAGVLYRRYEPSVD